MGFLGTGASFAADVNLIVQIILVVLLIASWMRLDKKNVASHGQLMVLAVIVQGLAIFLVMIPSLLLGFSAITSNPGNPGSLIAIAHGLVGAGAWLYAVYLSVIWRFNKATVECFKRKSMMKPVFYAWLAAAVLGVGFYVYYYVL